MNRPRTLAEVARRSNAGEQEFSSALREFLDEFYGALRVGTAAGLIAAAPEAIGDPQRHAFLGAVGEHLARRWDLHTGVDRRSFALPQAPLLHDAAGRPQGNAASTAAQ
jgi:hypothetical protein